MMNFPNQSSLGNTSIFGENNFQNYTYFKPSRPEWFWISMGFICVVTTIGNSLVILLICSKRSFRSKVSPNWFILSLGVADLLTGAYNIPVQFVCSFTTKCTYLTANFMFCLMSVFSTASTTNVCLLTFDIYLAVFHPFWYSNLMSPSKSRFFIISAWLLSVILNIAMFVSALHPKGDINAELADHVITILFYALSSVFLAYAFGRILLVVRSHKKDIAKHQLQLASNVNSHHDSLTEPTALNPRACAKRRNRDGTVTATGVVTASFLVCNGIWQYKLLHTIWPQQLPMTRAMVNVTHLVMYCNSTMNFIVYALLRNDLRVELESYFRRFYSKESAKNSELISLQQRQTNKQTGTLILRSMKEAE